MFSLFQSSKTNGKFLNIREKDAKDRIHEAIENQIESKFYKLDYVKSYYNVST